MVKKKSKPMYITTRLSKNILRQMAKSIVKTEANKYLVPNTDSESRW